MIICDTIRKIGCDIIKEIVTPLLVWYNKNKRQLQWRENKDPYRIWISEIMLQQTRVETVKPYFYRFIDVLPTVYHLACVEDEKLLKLWEGLGYYSRAKNLKIAANQILTQFNGKFPKRYEDLLKLKGIGPYSAGAISSIAFNEKKAAVDGNVLRVVSRLLNSFDDISLLSTNKKITNTIQDILPENSGDFNQAIMELGATVCTPKNFQCESCPIQKYCESYRYKTQAILPIKTKKIKIQKLKKTICILIYKNKIAIVKNELKSVFENMYIFPTFDEDVQTESLFPVISVHDLGKFKHIFTHMVWDIEAYYMYTYQLLPQFEWYSVDEILTSIALPAIYKKILEAYIIKGVNDERT